MTGAKQEVINSQQSPEGQASRFANVPLTESVRALYLHKTKPALTGTDSIASVIFEDFLDAGTVGTELTGSADKREIREALLRYKQIDSMANGVAVCQAIGRLFFLRELIQSYEASTDQLMLFFALKTLIDRSLVQAEELGITEEVVSQVAHAQYAARAEAGGQTPLEQTLAEQVWRQWVRREELDAPASVSFNARISADHNLDITLDLSQNLPGQIAQTVERYAQYLATADELVYPGFSAIAVCVYAVMQSAGWNVPMRKIGFRSDGSSPKGTIDLWQLRTEARHYYQQFPESIETNAKPEAARAKRVVLIGSRHGISEAQKQELAALEGLEVADMVFVPFDTGHVDPEVPTQVNLPGFEGGYIVDFVVQQLKNLGLDQLDLADSSRFVYYPASLSTVALLQAVILNSLIGTWPKIARAEPVEGKGFRMAEVIDVSQLKEYGRVIAERNSANKVEMTVLEFIGRFDAVANNVVSLKWQGNRVVTQLLDGTILTVSPVEAQVILGARKAAGFLRRLLHQAFGYKKTS